MKEKRFSFVILKDKFQWDRLFSDWKIHTRLHSLHVSCQSVGEKSGICCSYAIAKKPAQSHIWFRSQQQQPVCFELGFTWKFLMKPNETEEPKSEVIFKIFWYFLNTHDSTNMFHTEISINSNNQNISKFLRQILDFLAISRPSIDLGSIEFITNFKNLINMTSNFTYICCFILIP